MITTAMANSLLTTLMNGGSTGKYIGLFKSAPSAAGTGYTEVNGRGYERSLIKIGTNMEQPTNGQISNNAIIFFNEAEDVWADDDNMVTHFGVFATKAATTCDFFGELTTPIKIEQGYIPIFRKGALTVSIDRELIASASMD